MAVVNFVTVTRTNADFFIRVHPLPNLFLQKDVVRDARKDKPMLK